MNAMRAHIKKFLTINTSNIMRDESKVHDGFHIKTKSTPIKLLIIWYVLIENCLPFVTKIKSTIFNVKCNDHWMRSFLFLGRNGNCNFIHQMILTFKLDIAIFFSYYFLLKSVPFLELMMRGNVAKTYLMTTKLCSIFLLNWTWVTFEVQFNIQSPHSLLFKVQMNFTITIIPW